MGYYQEITSIYGIEFINPSDEVVNKLKKLTSLLYDDKTWEPLVHEKIVLMGDGIDCRIHATGFEQDAGIHIFGVHLAARNPWCSSHKITKHFGELGSENQKLWDTYCIKLLQQVELEVTQPQIYLLSQIV